MPNYAGKDEGINSQLKISNNNEPDSTNKQGALRRARVVNQLPWKLMSIDSAVMTIPIKKSINIELLKNGMMDFWSIELS